MLSYLNIETCFVLKFFRYMPLSEEKTIGIVRYHLNSDDKILVCNVLNKMVVLTVRDILIYESAPQNGDLSFRLHSKV